MTSRIEKVNVILSELEIDEQHHKKLSRKYKKLHSIFYNAQLLANLSSIGLCSSALGSLCLGIGVVTSIPLSTIGVILAGLGMVFSLGDKRVLKKLKKHSQLASLAKSANLELFQKYLCDEKVDEKEFVEIIKTMEGYYNRKDKMNENSVLVGESRNAILKEVMNGNGNGNGK